MAMMGRVRHSCSSTPIRALGLLLFFFFAFLVLAAEARSAQLGTGDYVTSVSSLGAQIDIVNTDATGNPPPYDPDWNTSPEANTCWYETTSDAEFSDESTVCWDLAPTAYDNSMVHLNNGNYLISYRWDNIFQCCPNDAAFDDSYNSYKAYMGTIILDNDKGIVTGTNHQELDLRTGNPFIPDQPPLGQDGRLFWFDGDIWLIYTDYATPESNYGNKLMYMVKLVEEEDPDSGDYGKYVVDGSSFVRLVPEGAGANSKEKNWAPFEYVDSDGNHELYMVYNWSDFTVLKVDLENDGSDLDDPNALPISTTAYDLKNTLWRKYGSPRGGTPAVYDADIDGYVSLIHSSIIENPEGKHNAPFGETPYNTVYYTTAVYFDAEPPFSIRSAVPVHIDYQDPEDGTRSEEGTAAQRAKGSRPELYSFYKGIDPVIGYGQNKNVIFPSGLVVDPGEMNMTVAYSRNCLDVFTADINKSYLHAAAEPYQLEASGNYCNANPSDPTCQAAHRIMYPAWSKQRDIVRIATRGYYGFRQNGAPPENTQQSVAAVDKFNATVPSNSVYLENPIEAVRIDVTLSEDGVPVAFHDSVLDRMTAQSGAVSANTWAELESYDLRSRSGQLTSITVNSLAEVISRASAQNGDAGYLVVIAIDEASDQPSVWTWSDIANTVMSTSSVIDNAKRIVFEVPYAYDDVSAYISQDDLEAFFYIPVVESNGSTTVDSLVTMIDDWEANVGLQILAYDVVVKELTDDALQPFTSDTRPYQNIFDYISQNTKGGRSLISSSSPDGRRGSVSHAAEWSIPQALDIRSDPTIIDGVDLGTFLSVATRQPDMWSVVNSGASIFPNADELTFD